VKVSSDSPVSGLTASHGRLPRLGLMRLFAAAGAAAIGIFSVAMAMLLGWFIEGRMLERDAAVSRDFVQSIAKVQRVAAVVQQRGDAGPATDPTFAEFIAHMAAMPDVLRVNVYGADRRVLWSSRPEMIGMIFGINDELDEALAGETVAHTADGPGQPDKAEHMLLGARPSEYVENYVPVVDDSGKRVIAVVELYRRPDALFEAIRSGQRLMGFGAVAGGGFLFLCLIGFVWHAEQRLREQQRQLIEADALAIVGEISAAVAHSIRNPLGSIRSSAELQRELGGDTDGTQTEIMRNVDRVETLVRSMLAYAADMPERGLHTDLAALVTEVTGRFAPELGRQGKRLELDLQPGLGRVAADPVLLSQILQSLLTNAAEASRDGGRVRVTGSRDASDAVLEISDTGTGIEPGRMATLFKPFQTSKPRGLGMGLALTHRVVKRLGGSVDIDSRPQVGTTVRVRLPVQAS
jgi:two-component system, NtrC family, sensor histidine kinase HydH